MKKLLRVGSETFDLGPPVVMEGLFATISYRLEPSGRGSRFPTVMARLYEGRLNASSAPAASRELEEIEAGLALLPLGSVVWSLADLRRRDDSQLPVNRSAQNACDYFVAGDGRSLVSVLRNAVRLSESRNLPVKLASSVNRGKEAMLWAMVAGGLLWAVAGFLLFPNWILTGAYDTSATHGPLIWPAGLFFSAGALVTLAMKRHPEFEERLNRKVWLTVLILLATCGLYLWLTWV